LRTRGEVFLRDADLESFHDEEESTLGRSIRNLTKKEPGNNEENSIQSPLMVGMKLT